MGVESRRPQTDRVGHEAFVAKVNQIDRSLGGRLRAKRTSSGLTLEQLANRLDIDPEDILSYETGAKRISADRLLRIAKVLGVRPVYFFGFPDDRTPLPDTRRTGLCEAPASYLTLPEQGLRLHRAFVNLPNDALRESIVALVVELAKSETAN